MNCCVPGCKGQSSPRHCFPNPSRDKEQFDRWLEMVGNVSLVGMDPMLIYKNRRVCDIHFDKSDIFGSRSSLPTLNLSTPPSTADDDSVSMAGSSQSDVSDVNIVDKPTEEPPDREVTAHEVAIKTEPLESDFQQQLFVKIEPMHCDNSEDGTPIQVKSEGGTDVEQLKQEELIIEHKTEVDSEGDIIKNMLGWNNKDLDEEPIDDVSYNNAMERRILLKHADPLANTAFECTECTFRSKHKKIFKEHMLLHSDPAQLQCKECGRQFTQTSNLRRHMATKHKDATQGMLSHSDPSQFVCNECGQQFNLISDLQQHVSCVHSHLRMFECNQCSFRTKDKAYLKQHKLLHSDPTQLVCKECGLQFTHSSNLRRHMSNKHKDTTRAMFECNECDFRSKYKKELKEHNMLLHPEPSPFDCKECGQQFNRISNLRQHMSYVHKDLIQGMIECKMCGFRSNNKSYFKQHTLLHSDPSQLKCKECGRQFTQISNLRQHMSIHKDPTQDEMFRCDECDYIGSSKKLLKSHKRIHYKAVYDI